MPQLGSVKKIYYPADMYVPCALLHVSFSYFVFYYLTQSYNVASTNASVAAMQSGPVLCLPLRMYGM